MEVAGVIVEPTAITINEDATTTYTVRLTTAPTETVTVTPSVVPDDEITLTAAPTFSPDAWNTARTVTVVAVTDDDPTTDTVTITHEVTGYGGLTADSVMVTVTDIINVPVFGGATITDQTYISGVEIPALTLPTAVGKPGTLSYALVGTLPAGLTVDVGTRTLTGTPEVAGLDATYTWIATDDDADIDILQFTIVVHETTVCRRTPQVRDAIVEAAGGVFCGTITTRQLREITALDLASAGLTTLQSSDLAGLTGLTRLDLSDNQLAVLPEGLLAGLRVLARLDLGNNRLRTLPDGLFDGLASLTWLSLAGNPGGPLTLDMDLESLGNGQFRARIREAAPLTAEVTWTVDGADGGTGVVTIRAGRRTSEAFGLDTATLESIKLSHLRFPGVTEDTADDAGDYRGFRLQLAGAVAREVVIITAATLTVPEGGTTTYAIRLNSLPAVAVTVTPGVPADSGVTLSGPLTFTTSTWHTFQAVTVAAGEDADNADAVVTITHAVSSYGAVSADAVVVTVTDNGNQLADINRVILPEVARAMADQRVGMIARRIQQARSDTSDGTRSLTFGGQSTLAGIVTTHGKTIAEGNFNLKTLMGGSGFVLPLNAREIVPSAGLTSLTLWGSGDYRSLGGKSQEIDWNGDLFTAHLGADARLRNDLLAGLAVSWSRADLGYNVTGLNPRRGDYEVALTTVHPYVGWTLLGGRLDVWATAGYGWGKLEVTGSTTSGQASSDVTTQTFGAGGSGQLLKRGGTTLRLKGEALHTSMDVDESDDIEAIMVESRRTRLSLEASHTHTLAGGGQLVPTVEVGMRNDAGDGRTGTGAELGGGLRYTDSARGLTVESRGRVLVGHTGDYHDWGLSGAVKFATGSGGRGFSLSLQPSWGSTGSRAAQVWSQEAATMPVAASPPRNGQVDVDLGYGLGWDEFLVTPYGRMTLTNSPARSYRVGGRMRLGGQMTLDLEGTREETAARLVNHGIRLQFGLGPRLTFSLEGTRKQTTAQALNHGIKLQVGLGF